MKMILVLATLLTATVSFAQKPKAVSHTATTQTTTTTYVGAEQNELTINAGFVSGAVNLGATFAQMQGSTGLGGYIHFQTEKDKVVNQAIALGALYKINFVETSKATFYAAPGAGLALVKVASTTTIGGTDDKTVFGPSLKIGALVKLSPTFSMGIERGIVTNYFEENAPPSFELTTLAMTFLL